jgi:ubiquitin carboxyl-terminal hydrolase L3
LIYDDEELNAAHESSAQESTVPLPAHCTTHYTTFVELGGNLWELDGRKPQPICHGDVTDLLRSSLKVIQEDFMPNLDDPLQISIVALVLP